MNASFIWIILPLVAAVVIWFFRQARWLAALSGAAVCLVFLLLSEFLPIDQTINLGQQTVEISSEFIILGRRLVINDIDRPILALVFTLGLFWFLASGFVATNKTFVPIGMVCISLWLAALSVQPFLYAGLIIEVVVLLSIPMLITPGKQPGQGVLRYLIYQTFSVPIILLSGWVASGAEANPANEQLVSQTAVLLGLGFAFLLAAFPFYSWVPKLAGETRPLVSGFLLSVQPVVVLLFALNFYDTYAWLREIEAVRTVLISMGGVMVVLGDLWAASQEDLRRMFGYLVILENGISLMILSLTGRVGVEILLISFLPRIICLGVFSISLAIFEENGVSLSLRDMRGMMHKFPLAGSALVLSMLGCAGVPVLVGFPIMQTLLENISVLSIFPSFLLLGGSAGLILGAFRIFGIFSEMKYDGWKITESRSQIFLLLFGIIILLIAGIVPGLFYPGLVDIIRAFPNLG